MSGGGGTEVKTLQSTEKKEVPPELKPFVLGGDAIPKDQAFLPRAFEISQRGLEPALPSPGKRLEPFSASQEAALSAIEQRGLQGTPGLSEAGGFLTNLLTTDPYDDPAFTGQLRRGQQDIVDQFNLSTAPQLSLLSRNSGSFGNSSAAAVAQNAAFGPQGLTRSLGDFESSLLADRQRQAIQGAGLIPALQQVGFTDLSQALNAGSARQSFGQSTRDINFQNLLEERAAPLRELDILGAALQGATGTFINTSGTQQQFAPAQPNSALQGLGAGASILGSAAKLAPLFFS